MSLILLQGMCHFICMLNYYIYKYIYISKNIWKANGKTKGLIDASKVEGLRTTHKCSVTILCRAEWYFIIMYLSYTFLCNCLGFGFVLWFSTCESWNFGGWMTFSSPNTNRKQIFICIMLHCSSIITHELAAKVILCWGSPTIINCIKGLH